MRLQLARHSGLSIFMVLAIGALTLTAWNGAATPSTDKSKRPREVPDDPPGVPARPVPGARRAAPVRFMSFSSVQTNVDINGANIPGDAANEPSIAVDPTFPNKMAIGWRQFDTVASNFRQAGWAYTRDGGRTWTFPGVIDPGVFRSDPVLDSDAEGNFYYNSLQVTGGAFTCQVFKSTNGAIMWGPAANAWGGDKQWMTIDRTGGIGHGHVYHSWSTAAGCCGNDIFSRSIDGGHIFQTPIAHQVPLIWGTLAVASDGTLWISGVDTNNQTTFLVARSPDAKNPAVTPSLFLKAIVDMGGVIGIGLGYISPNPVGLLGQVWIAVDNSGGPNDGNLYMLCSVDPPGLDPLDVHFVRSTDGGVTWSTPVRVNDDTPGNNAWQWFGTMSVAPNGRIDAVWNDSRNTGEQNESELFYSSSVDGGLTWSPNQQLSLVWDSHVGFPNQDKVGDYYDMVSDDLGANLAWAATFNGEQDVYYLRIGDYDCNTNGVGDSLDIALGGSDDDNGNGIPDECELGVSGIGGDDVLFYSLHQNTPNPFNPYTLISFDVPVGGGHMTLRVFDVTGRAVRTLVDGFRSAGGQFEEWDGTDDRGREVASGLYFYKLTAPDFSETRKMVLLR